MTLPVKFQAQPQQDRCEQPQEFSRSDSSDYIFIKPSEPTTHLYTKLTTRQLTVLKTQLVLRLTALLYQLLPQFISQKSNGPISYFPPHLISFQNLMILWNFFHQKHIIIWLTFHQEQLIYNPILTSNNAIPQHIWLGILAENYFLAW